MIWIAYILAVIGVLNLGMMLRNTFLLRYRIRMIEEDFDGYMKLPSYYVMLYKFWKPFDSFMRNP